MGRTCLSKLTDCAASVGASRSAKDHFMTDIRWVELYRAGRRLIYTAQIQQIGKYKIETELGHGGMGRVYRAWDPDMRRPVAIKVLLVPGDADSLKRFRS